MGEGSLQVNIHHFPPEEEFFDTLTDADVNSKRCIAPFLAVFLQNCDIKTVVYFTDYFFVCKCLFNIKKVHTESNIPGLSQPTVLNSNFVQQNNCS